MYQKSCLTCKLVPFVASETLNLHYFYKSPFSKLNYEIFLKISKNSLTLLFFQCKIHKRMDFALSKTTFNIRNYVMDRKVRAGSVVNQLYKKLLIFFFQVITINDDKDL